MLATLSSSHSDALRSGGASVASALTSGYHLAYLIGAALVLAAIAVGMSSVLGVHEVVGLVTGYSVFTGLPS